MSNSPKRPQFVNPLLQPTTNGAPPAAPVVDQGNAPGAPAPASAPFEANHTRMTNWIDKQLKERFDHLCAQRGKGSRTRLLNEALADLLRKYKA